MQFPGAEILAIPHLQNLPISWMTEWTEYKKKTKSNQTNRSTPKKSETKIYERAERYRRQPPETTLIAN